MYEMTELLTMLHSVFQEL